MKKVVSVFILIVLIYANLFAQTQNQVVISDYFPTKVLTLWTYASAAGKEFWTIFVKNHTQDNGIDVCLFEEQWKGLGSTQDLYIMTGNQVLLVSSKPIWGDWRDYPEPYPIILAEPNKAWQENDRGDDLNYQTIAASCKFDGRVFNDCICVIQTLILENSVKRTKKSYYARGIGLVYVTITDKDGESAYMRLTESSLLNE